MTPLKERLEEIDGQISNLQDRKEWLIASEEPEFQNIALPYYVLNDRYVIVHGDGSLIQHYENRFSQRPAAFRHVQNRPGRYVLDLRKGEVLDAEEKVLARFELEEPVKATEPTASWQSFLNDRKAKVVSHR